jgi:hypothetical protein
LGVCSKIIKRGREDLTFFEDLNFGKMASKCIRVHVPLSVDNPKTNVFNCPDLIKKHLRGSSSSNAMQIDHSEESEARNDPLEGGSREESNVDQDMDDDSEEEEENAGQVRRSYSNAWNDYFFNERLTLLQKPKRIDYTNNYDSEDDFIDDSELYYKEDAYVAPVTEAEIGFFAWKGPIENFFEE